MEHFSIIQALCRTALATPNTAIIQQVERLKKTLEKAGKTKEAKALADLLELRDKSVEMAPSRITRSFIMTGEELTVNTPIPVDKETSTPLAQIIFKESLPSEGPLLNSDVKAAIESILVEWKSYDALSKIDAQPSRSCLIYGEPGTGKTQLALWFAKQIGLPVVLARLDGLMSSFLGTSSRNIGNLFAFASKYKCVLLLDEFDAIAKLRDDPHEVGEIKRVVNTLLQNLDLRGKIGFTIGITNHEGLLDPAIWRRFDTQIHIPKPSKDIIPSLLKKFLQPLKIDEMDIEFLTWGIEGSSGADIESLALWMKKSLVLNPDASVFNHVKQFVVLNSGRINEKKKGILSLPENDLIPALAKTPDYNFNQTALAQVFKRSQSSVSKLLSKTKEYAK